MSQIKIDVNDVHTEHKQFKNTYRKVRDTAEQVSSLRQRIDSRITQRRSIDYRLSQAASGLARVESQLQSIYEWIDNGLEAYIQADKKASEHPFHKKKKSIWDRIGDGLMSVAHGITGFMEGTVEAVIGTVEGIWTMVTHPIATIQGVVYVVTHPVEAAQGIWKAVTDSWTNDVVNGDSKSRGKWFGRMIGEVALGVIGTKSIDKIGKLAKGSRVLQETGGVRVVEGVRNVEDIARNRVHASPIPPKPDVEDLDVLTKPDADKSAKPDTDIPPKVLPDEEDLASPVSKGTEGMGNIISEVDKLKLSQWKYRPSDELYIQYKHVFDKPKYYDQSTGSINWPINDGFEGVAKDTSLRLGARIDRYGFESGTFVSPEGIPYEMRSLAPGTKSKPYHVYGVLKPIDGLEGKIAPWFDEVGGGVQYKLTKSIQDLLDEGYLREVFD